MEGWKVVYSGDTRPHSQELVRAGWGADLLIHEATFGRGSNEDHARVKRHLHYPSGHPDRTEDILLASES